MQGRTHNCGQLRLANVGEEVKLVGWYENLRKVSKNLGFLILRDFYGTTQIVVETEEIMEQLSSINYESTIEIIGTVRERSSKNANLPTGEIEVVPSKLTVLGKCRYNELPFQINHSKEADENVRLKYRYLDLRRPNLQRNLLLRSKVATAIRRFMDAEGFLEIIRKEGEIKRLRRCRGPIRLFSVSDAPMCSSGMTFTDGSSIEKETTCGDKALDYLYVLADKYYAAAEKLEPEICAVSVDCSCMDYSSSYSFTMKKEGYDWFLSYDAAIDDSGIHTEAQDQQIGEADAEEILRIVKEQQLITSVKEYEELPDEEVYALDETIYRISFEFADGSSIDAPIDAGNELVHWFYQLAKRIEGK